MNSRKIIWLGVYISTPNIHTHTVNIVIDVKEAGKDVSVLQDTIDVVNNFISSYYSPNQRLLEFKDDPVWQSSLLYDNENNVIYAREGLDTDLILVEDVGFIYTDKTPFGSNIRLMIFWVTPDARLEGIEHGRYVYDYLNPNNSDIQRIDGYLYNMYNTTISQIIAEVNEEPNLPTKKALLITKLYNKL